MENNTLLYQAVVIDNEDPMMLGRVRAKFQNPPSDMGSYEDIIKSIKKSNKIIQWSYEDQQTMNKRISGNQETLLFLHH